LLISGLYYYRVSLLIIIAKLQLLLITFIYRQYHTPGDCFADWLRIICSDRLTSSDVSTPKMGNMLDAPLTAKDSHILECSGLICGATGMQGWRLEMEDKHIMCEVPGTEGFVLLAVFDGHGGDGAAIYAEATLINKLHETVEWKTYLETRAEDPVLLGNALVKAYVSLDVALRQHQDAPTDRHKADRSGCTAVCTLITPKYIICANAGDSRSVMGTAGSTKPLSYDHKPNDELERKRIESAGGCVQWKRVDGDLAVSRAFGDFQYKTASHLPSQEQKVFLNIMYYSIYCYIRHY
jgi:serine/threonine protein phosphatase PrpC